MSKCPLCNNNISKKDVRIRLESLRLSRSPKLLEQIDGILNDFSKHWDIDNVIKAGFLADIENIEEDIIRDSIRKFKGRAGIQRGYGIKYLSGIIKNESKRVALRREYEKKNLDRIPPKLKENDEKY